MTAEIAILNKSAVALAADSALTVGYGNEQKIYHTHKLFMLSRINPVGIMIYNNANLLSLPWETIIKQYRKNEGTRTFNRLLNYAEHFLSYLENNTLFFPESVQDNQAVRDVLSALIFLRDRIDDSIEESAQTARKVKLVDINRIVEAWIETTYETFEKIPLRATYPGDHKRKVYSRYVSAIEVLIDEVFQTLPLSPKLRKKLRRISLYSLLVPSRISGGNFTGIVIAGFGDQDLHPALATYRIDSVVLSKLRYMNLRERKIEMGHGALVYAFAQSEVVQGFMDGITPDLEDEIENAINIQLDYFGESVLKMIPGMTPKKKRTVVGEIEKIKEEILKTFSQELRSYKEDNSDPIVHTVAVLPKEELATMAETLVNLTSFKRRVTLDAETVGGPIDVAVISKGDGFIWIKRKHYFDAGLNPHFLKNHF